MDDMKFFKRKPADQNTDELELYKYWYITLPDIEDVIDNGDSIQFYNDDFVVYASLLVNPKDMSEKTIIEPPEQDSSGDWNLKANIRDYGRILVLAITYKDATQHKEAEAIIRSVRVK